MCLRLQLGHVCDCNRQKRYWSPHTCSQFHQGAYGSTIKSNLRDKILLPQLCNSIQCVYTANVSSVLKARTLLEDDRWRSSTEWIESKEWWTLHVEIISKQLWSIINTHVNDNFSPLDMKRIWTIDPESESTKSGRDRWSVVNFSDRYDSTIPFFKQPRVARVSRHLISYSKHLNCYLT